MATANPTHEQGQLQLQLYDLRREAKLRQARDWFNQNYFAGPLKKLCASLRSVRKMVHTS